MLGYLCFIQANIAFSDQDLLNKRMFMAGLIMQCNIIYIICNSSLEPKRKLHEL